MRFTKTLSPSTKVLCDNHVTVNRPFSRSTRLAPAGQGGVVEVLVVQSRSLHCGKDFSGGTNCDHVASGGELRSAAKVSQ